MRFVAKLAAIQFTLLPGSGTTTWTTDSKPLFLGEFLLHSEDIVTQNYFPSLFNVAQGGRVSGNTGNHVDRKDFCLGVNAL